MIRINSNGQTEIALINIFESINGEGYNAGKPTVFIRTFGCNLRCAFPCDTVESWSQANLLKIYPERASWESPFLWLTSNEIFDIIQEMEINYKHKSICITGGEPLMEENKEFMLNELIPMFVAAKYDVGIETSGSIDYTDYKERFGKAEIVDAFGSREGVTIVADYKLTSSKMYHKMIKSNLSLYDDTDIVKVVISDEPQDWKDLDELVLSDTKAAIYISPCFNNVTMCKIPEYVMHHCNKNIKAQLQLHKFFWEPTRKDV